MRRQIVRLSVGQTSKVLAAMYGLMGVVLVPFFLLAALSGPAGGGMSLGFALVMPVIYAALGYVFVAIGCAVYNFVARHLGGIEFELDGPGDLGA